MLTHCCDRRPKNISTSRTGLIARAFFSHVAFDMSINLTWNEHKLKSSCCIPNVSAARTGMGYRGGPLAEPHVVWILQRVELTRRHWRVPTAVVTRPHSGTQRSIDAWSISTASEWSRCSANGRAARLAWWWAKNVDFLFAPTCTHQALHHLPGAPWAQS